MQFICGTLIICLAAVHAESEARQDQLFASWQGAQLNVKSLVVHFTLEQRYGSFIDKADGTFRLIRTPNGQIFASYQVFPAKESLFLSSFSGLLNGGTIYVLNEEEKTAFSLRSIQGDLMQFLEKHFHPFVLLLDRKHAKEKCHLQVVKRDEWYTYLTVTPKKVERDEWFREPFQKGRVVLMNKSNEGVPKDMPRELRYIYGSHETIFDIKSWRLNAQDAPKVEEFTKPEDRAGWKVSELQPLGVSNSGD